MRYWQYDTRPDSGRHAARLRDEERVALDGGEGVEDGERVRGLEDLERGDLAADDLRKEVLIVVRHRRHRRGWVSYCGGTTPRGSAGALCPCPPGRDL
jgi:hypothetical protein